MLWHNDTQCFLHDATKGSESVGKHLLNKNIILLKL